MRRLLLLALLAMALVVSSSRQPDALSGNSASRISQQAAPKAPIPMLDVTLLSPQSRSVRGEVDLGLEPRRPGRRHPPATPLQDAYVQTVWAPDARQRLRLRNDSAAADAFDLRTAEKMGRLTSVAYCTARDIQAWNCTRCQQLPDFAPTLAFFDPIWDLQAYVGYSPSLRGVVVAFRGTDSSYWGNWVENLRTWTTDHMYPLPEAPHARIHSGFFALWTASRLQATVMPAVTELLAAHAHDASTTVYVAGHSMGGALAQLCAMDLKLNHTHHDVRVFTFGAPRVGNAAFAQLFDSFVEQGWRFTHNRDIVPSVPLQLMGFHHAAYEVFITDVQAPNSTDVSPTQVVCDGSGEDPACHDGVCFLGLCTSLADHMVYLGMKMYWDPVECGGGANSTAAVQTS